MACTDFQGVYDVTWFPTAGVSTDLDMIQSISMDLSDSLTDVKGDNDVRVRSFTVASSSTSGTVTTKNLSEALSTISFGVLGVLSFKCDDRCIGGSGEAMTVTVEQTIFSNKSFSVQTESGTAPALSFRAGSTGQDGQTDPTTFAFA